LITFLSLLELAKIGIVHLFQSDNFSEIYVETKKPVDRDSISKVETYESQVNVAASNATGATGDIWLNDNDRNGLDSDAGTATAAESAEAPAPVQLALTAANPADAEYEVAPATDSEIELEEQLYGENQTGEENKASVEVQADAGVVEPDLGLSDERGSDGPDFPERDIS
jgi:hypothetical protein